MTRIAIVDNTKLRDMSQKRHIQNLCPVNRTGHECIRIEADGRLTIDESLCTGCGICPKAAPEAIAIINLPEALKSIPVHRYGENAFVLYSLPTPPKNKVTGLLGVNGIGKSTAVKIIAGLLKPNLGDWEKGQGEFRDLIDHFKGTEAQQFFEDLRDSKITLSYKPQQVELIPKTARGKVRDLLAKVDTTGRLDSVVDQLDLSHILDNDIQNLSGGELQRTAIAAAVLKDATLYLFDEPSSYLDIKQRINTSKFIRTLASEKTGVLLVEHDLIILDYMTDLTHIMYGQEAAYGIVSGVKPTKAGINIFLSGFLKEENVRFRQQAIRFEDRPPMEESNTEPITSWTDLRLTQGKFSLDGGSGTIHRKDIIGVLGENGIGKTTFVKLLAGELKPDSGEVEGNVRVSYKPQYIEPSDDLVINVLQKAFDKYHNQLISPLKLENLQYSKVSDLSGGELQRVAICQCLQEDADLFLMDEPSAYLDVEQRLLVSKVIRDLMEQRGTTSMIVDHDLLFIDHISTGLMVFDGQPARSGQVRGPFTMEEGMNHFLEGLNITLRRDPEANRPRINKLDSRLDREQKEKRQYYYG